MTDGIDHPSAGPIEGPSPRPGLRRELRAGALWVAATLTLELGAYALAIWHGSAPREALLAALASATMWVALTSAPLAAGAAGNWAAILRAAVPADASLVAMLILWPLARSEGGGTYLWPAGIAETYCILAGLSLFSAAAVCCARGTTSRRCAALAAAVVLSAAIATPFWAGGLLHAVGLPHATSLVTWAIRANPFYCVLSAVAERMRFFWQEWGLMYERIGSFRDYAPPPLEWYASPAIYGALAAALGLAATLRRKSLGEAGARAESS